MSQEKQSQESEVAIVELDRAMRSELEQLQTRLAQERAVFEALFTMMPIPVAIFSGDDLVFDFVNATYAAVFPGRQLVGVPLMTAIPELEGQGFDEHLREVRRTGVPYIGREEVLHMGDAAHPDDSYWTFIFAPMVGLGGTPDRVICIATEITEQVVARETLSVLAREASAANLAKDHLFARLSHELRTPISAARMWLQVLRKASPNVDPARAIEAIDRGLNAQMELIDELLDASRVSSGKLRLDLATVDLANVVRLTVETMRPTAETRNVTLSCEGAAEANVTGDAARLRQVVTNLLANAIKFSHAGGAVDVRVDVGGGEVRVAVTDRGWGIAECDLSRVFEPFWQAEGRDPSMPHTGLGLGLAIVRQLVELHDGRVWAESEGEGKGATLIFTVPRE